jgi:hypothetical protein
VEEWLMFKRFFGGRSELDELRQTVADAKAALTELREFASILTSAMLTELMAESFSDSMPLSTRLAIRDHLVASLEALGATREQIDRTLVEWRKGIGIIYHRIIRAKIQQCQRFTTPDNPQKPKIEWVNEFQNLLDFDKWRAPTPDEWKLFCKRTMRLHRICKSGLTTIGIFSKQTKSAAETNLPGARP